MGALLNMSGGVPHPPMAAKLLTQQAHRQRLRFPLGAFSNSERVSAIGWSSNALISVKLPGVQQTYGAAPSSMKGFRKR